jgi:hypothetical protein
MRSGSVKDCDWGVWVEGSGALELGQSVSTADTQVLVTGSTEVGVGIDNASDNQIKQVKVIGGSDDDWVGIQVLPDADATLTRCRVDTATGSNATGIFLESEATVYAPDVSGISDGAGILINTDSTEAVTILKASTLGTLWTHPVVKNCEYGMSIQGYSRPVIRKSTIEDHDTCVFIGLVAVPDLGTTVNDGHNAIASASVRLAGGRFRDESAADVKAEENWWGNDPPNGAKISSWVDYVPYLDSDSLTTVGFDMEVAEVVPRQVVVFPTPAQGVVRIGYQVPSTSRVSVQVFDLQGRLLRTVEEATMPAGAYFSSWDGRTASGFETPAGVYLVRVRVGNQVNNQKIIRTP